MQFFQEPTISVRQWRNKGEKCYPCLRFTQKGYFDTDQEIDIGNGHILMAKETSDNVRVSKKYSSE